MAQLGTTSTLELKEAVRLFGEVATSIQYDIPHIQYLRAVGIGLATTSNSYDIPTSLTEIDSLSVSGEYTGDITTTSLTPTPNTGENQVVFNNLTHAADETALSAYNKLTITGLGVAEGKTVVIRMEGRK